MFLIEKLPKDTSEAVDETLGKSLTQSKLIEMIIIIIDSLTVQ